MKIVKILVETVSNKERWEEEVEIADEVKDLNTHFKEMVEEFNRVEKERYGDKGRPRKLVKVIGVIGSVEYCDFEKMTMAQTDVYGHTYDLLKCRQCSFEYRRYGLETPKQECHPERTCTICNKVFKTEKNYQRHKEKKHKEEKEGGGSK